MHWLFNKNNSGNLIQPLFKVFMILHRLTKTAWSSTCVVAKMVLLLLYRQDKLYVHTVTLIFSLWLFQKETHWHGVGGDILIGHCHVGQQHFQDQGQWPSLWGCSLGTMLLPQDGWKKGACLFACGDPYLLSCSL